MSYAVCALLVWYETIELLALHHLRASVLRISDIPERVFDIVKTLRDNMPAMAMKDETTSIKSATKVLPDGVIAVMMTVSSYCRLSSCQCMEFVGLHLCMLNTT